MRRFPSLLLIGLAWHHAAWAQTAADLQAARETELPGLRLLDTRDLDSRLAGLGVRLGYLEEDVRPGHYFCGALTENRGMSVAPHVVAALVRLPYWPARRLGVRFVILCGGVKDGDRSIGGFPVPPLDLLMLDVPTSNAAFLETATLHELYHLAEVRFNTLNDADWGRQFTGYSNSYASELLKGALGSGKPGFLNAYAETFAHEDRAELFAALLLKPGDLVAQIHATRDSVLRSKVWYLVEKSQRLLGLRLTPDGL